jgi:DNA mismatch repair protein MutS
MGDLERVAGRIGAGTATPRDLAALCAGLERVAAVRAALLPARAPLLAELGGRLDPLPAVAARIGRALADGPPAHARGGGMIRAGYHAEVDELRQLSRDGKGWIARLEARERERTGIGSLKIRYNRVFGYYIEVTKPNLHLIPSTYQRKQTVVGGERFITPELKDYEAKVLGAEERLRGLEAELFAELVAEVAQHQAALGATAAALGQFDALVSLAEVAHRRGYTRPQVTRDLVLDVTAGRHPVVEALAGAAGFVPNDCHLDPADAQIVVVTGPNMAGKSTYLRQTALIVLLAQMGSFVPATEATIGLVDRIFTRVGAADNLAAGESTFMVEMRETASILAGTTPRSLVILDEIGRGTSTFDGISIAWAVAEYLHDQPAARPRTLFATHYHELTELARVCPRVGNVSVAVREWKGEVVFLRRIVPGAASRSYGIEVARLAGVPPPVVARAKEVLANLERGEWTESGLPRPAGAGSADAPAQLPLFAAAEGRLQRELSGLEVERLTPLEALHYLQRLVEIARSRS